MGMNVKQIAALLKLSTKTVEFHIANVKSRLGFSDPARLTHFAISRKLIALNQTAT